jgi:hypothetical protein
MEKNCEFNRPQSGPGAKGSGGLGLGHGRQTGKVFKNMNSSVSLNLTKRVLASNSKLNRDLGHFDGIASNDPSWKLKKLIWNSQLE